MIELTITDMDAGGGSHTSAIVSSEPLAECMDFSYGIVQPDSELVRLELQATLWSLLRSINYLEDHLGGLAQAEFMSGHMLTLRSI